MLVKTQSYDKTGSGSLLIIPEALFNGLKKAGLFTILFLLAACGGTSNYIEQPSLSISGTSDLPQQALEGLYSKVSAPYTISFCEADESSGECLPDEAKPSAKGIGGIFIPLVMNFSAIEMKQIENKSGVMEFTANIKTTVNGIPPACGTVTGTISMTGENSALLKFSDFYCNWVVIGNVVTQSKFSIDQIDLSERSFTGYYALSFFGTGNASGSGYYRAVITSEEI